MGGSAIVGARSSGEIARPRGGPRRRDRFGAALGLVAKAVEPHLARISKGGERRSNRPWRAFRRGVNGGRTAVSKRRRGGSGGVEPPWGASQRFVKGGGRHSTRAGPRESSCGSFGEVELAAPLSLRGPGRKKLELVQRIGFRPSNVDKKLRAWCAPASFGEGTETRTDARVRDGRQLYARDGALTVEGFDDALRDILCKIRESLCPHEAAAPVAELHSLNVYGRGGHFVAHKDTPRDPSVFATLVVCLPLPFYGGRLVVEQQARATFDWEKRPAFMSSFGSSLDTADLQIRWAAFFGDVDHHIEMVTSGCRATLTYELRRAPDAEPAVLRQPSEKEAAFAAALAAALADPKFVADGGRFGMPCLHLYAVPTRERTLPGIASIRDHLKGRDRLVALALERAGLVPRVVPYVFETCAGDTWRLHRDANTREKQMFTQKRLRGSILEDKLPIEFHADWNQSDDVTWLARPPWLSSYREPGDGRPEPEVALLGQPEYSATDYFGNEASEVSFYAAAAILFDVPPESARKRVAG